MTDDVRDLRLMLAGGIAGCALAVSASAMAGTQTREQALVDRNTEGRRAGLAAPDTHCQDFLQTLVRKPDTLQYPGCEQDDASHIKPTTARYRVSGASAAAMESCVHDTFGVPVLCYACCGRSSGSRVEPGSTTHPPP